MAISKTIIAASSAVFLLGACTNPASLTATSVGEDPYKKTKEGALVGGPYPQLIPIVCGLSSRLNPKVVYTDLTTPENPGLAPTVRISSASGPGTTPI